MRALIVDPWDGRGTLAAVRGLAGAGWKVGVAGPTERTLATASRRCGGWHPVPRLEDGEAAFIDAVNRVVSAGSYELVFGAGDPEVLVLSRERDGLRARVPYPSHDRVERALDKLALAGAAQAVGMATPATAVAGDPGAPAAGPGAVVVKDRTHAALRGHPAQPRLEAEICETRDAVAARVAQVNGAGGQALVQELVAGPLAAFATVVGPGGELVARVQQRAERTWGAGCSVRARTVPIDEQLAARVQALLAELQWVGLVQLQFIEPAEGEPRLIDFNGRFYGSMALALAAGVNLAALWARVATGEDVESRVDARPGVRYQHLAGDLQAARAERRRGLARTVAGCVLYAARAHHSIISLRDPRPGLRAGVRFAAGVRRTTRRRLAGVPAAVDAT